MRQRRSPHRRVAVAPARLADLSWIRRPRSRHVTQLEIYDGHRVEDDEPRSEAREDVAANPAVVDGAVTGSLAAQAGGSAGLAGMIAGGLFGWLVTRWARRRHPSS